MHKEFFTAGEIIQNTDFLVMQCQFNISHKNDIYYFDQVQNEQK